MISSPNATATPVLEAEVGGPLRFLADRQEFGQARPIPAHDDGPRSDIP